MSETASNDPDEFLDSLPHEKDAKNKAFAEESMSLTNSLKRGFKLKDQSDTVSLSGALKKGFRKQYGLKAAESTQSLNVDSSTNSTKKLLSKSPRKLKKSQHNSESATSSSTKQVKESRSPREFTVKLNDVLPNSTVFEDTVSMIEGLLGDPEVPIPLQEGIRDTIGRKNVVTLKKMVKLERAHGSKADAKVLVLTPYRCQLLGVKPPFKMEADFHFLNIRSMDSPAVNRLTISTKHGKVYFLQMIGNDDADHIIGRVALSLRTIFPNVSLSRILKATLEPLSRQKVIQSLLNQADENEPGPCGNFSEMYRCWCDHLNAPVKEDVEWDVDTIYLSQNCKDINLTDFDLTESKDVIPIISVMTYNRWFEGLVVKNTKLSNDVLDAILKVARTSHNLKKLVLEGVALKGDFAQRLTTQLIENKDSCIEVLDLSNNPVEDKGLLHLSGMMPLIKNGSICKLNFSKTGLTSKGVNGLCQSLRSSPNIMKNLTSIDLSGNTIKTDEAEGLYSFLASENHLTEIDLSSTDCSVDSYMAAIAKGCTSHLETIRLGRNHFHAKKKDNVVHASFQEFFENTTALKSVDFSHMKFPPEALRYVMNGLVRNNTKGLEVELILASCELKSAGCQVLQSNIGSVTNLVKLDVSDNSFDSDLIGLLAWIQQNRFVRELRLGKNFSGIKPKYMKKVMDALVEVVQEEDTSLCSLSLADSKIREYLSILLGCLGSNSSLTSLDISGNFIGDSGARVLAKSLQINSKLKILDLDRNNITALGFHEIATALEKNFTLRYMRYPIIDAMASMKHYAERVQSSLARIQDLLLRNGSVKSASSEQQFRLQKVVTSTAQIVLDRVAEKVDNVIVSLESLDGDHGSGRDVKKAKKLVQDAKNSKQLLTDMYSLAVEKTTGHGSRLNEKISGAAGDWEKIAQDHFKDIVAVMLRNAEANCPHIYEEIASDLQTCVDQRCRLEPGVVKDDVIKTSGVDLVNKMSELNLTLATLVSDTMTDKLLAALSHCSSTLTEQLNKAKTAPKSDPVQADDAESKEEKEKKQAKDASKNNTNGSVEARSEELLPTMRRQRAQSIAKRKQRPATSLPGEEDRKSGDSSLTGAIEVDSSLHDETVSFDSKRVSDGSDKFPESEEVLDHITKGRPRGPNNRQKRKRPVPQTADADAQNVDNFFQNNVSNTDFSEVLTVQEEDDKKQNENFKESRNKTVSSTDRHHVDALKAKKNPYEESSEKGDSSMERSPRKARPKTMFALPGAGMGNDMLAEIKLKKLAKKTNGDSHGRVKDEEASQNNNNNNNNHSVPKPIPRARTRTTDKGANEEIHIENKSTAKEGKTALMPGKKLPVGKTPPPLPSKPKPPLLRGTETKPRPVTEFHESKLPPLFKKPRASSMKSGDKDE